MLLYFVISIFLTPVNEKSIFIFCDHLSRLLLRSFWAQWIMTLRLGSDAVHTKSYPSLTFTLTIKQSYMMNYSQSTINHSSMGLIDIAALATWLVLFLFFLRTWRSLGRQNYLPIPSFSARPFPWSFSLPHTWDRVRSEILFSPPTSGSWLRSGLGELAGLVFWHFIHTASYPDCSLGQRA